jgi:NAD(P)-dependent dehydrogenase (short-subunit alcohol dehydrogenase family)
MRIATVGIVGAGTMGGGIATNLARHGFRVLLADARTGAAREAVAGAGAFHARAVEKGRMTAADAAAASERLQVVETLAGLAPADLVIEAVFEDFDLKARLLAELSPLLRAEALVANGKPKRLALAATMRTLLLTRIAIAKHNTPWREQTLAKAASSSPSQRLLSGGP